MFKLRRSNTTTSHGFSSNDHGFSSNDLCAVSTCQEPTQIVVARSQAMSMVALSPRTPLPPISPISDLDLQHNHNTITQPRSPGGGGPDIPVNSPANTSSRKSPWGRPQATELRGTQRPQIGRSGATSGHLSAEHSRAAAQQLTRHIGRS